MIHMRGHAHRGDIYIGVYTEWRTERTYTWKEIYARNDIRTGCAQKGHTPGGNIVPLPYLIISLSSNSYQLSCLQILLTVLLISYPHYRLSSLSRFSISFVLYTDCLLTSFSTNCPSYRLFFLPPILSTKSILYQLSSFQRLPFRPISLFIHYPLPLSFLPPVLIDITPYQVSSLLRFSK